VIESKDALIAECRECKRALPDAAAKSAAELRITVPRSINSSSFKDNVDEHQQKRARVTLLGSEPLEHDDILDRIFSLVGRKEWLYAGGVCRRWRGRYLSMCYRARASKAEPVYQTSRRSSFVTAARFSMALGHGLIMPDAGEAGKFFDDLPWYSQQPVEVLTLARVRGAGWHKDFCRDAAFYGDFELLKWLHTSGCPLDALAAAGSAIRGKRLGTSGQLQHEHILPWLFNTVDQWSQGGKGKLLLEAGVAHDVGALELLLSKGAEWPSSFFGELQPASGKTFDACWRYEVIAWALNKGCTWGEWSCQDFAPEWYGNQYNRENAKGLFEWAHKHDCPCTCEAAAADAAQ
jgi:hypothetical protein